jgi:uncharacterized protein YukE
VSNALPVVGGASYPASAPSQVAVDPAMLARLAGQFQQRAAAMRSATPALISAWQVAADALAGQHTGELLAATWPSSRAALEGVAGSVEALARVLGSSAAKYADVDAAAVPGSSAP